MRGAADADCGLRTAAESRVLRTRAGEEGKIKRYSSVQFLISTRLRIADAGLQKHSYAILYAHNRDASHKYDIPTRAARGRNALSALPADRIEYAEAELSSALRNRALC